MDRSLGFIVAKTGQTMKSWGEIITFNIREVNDKVRIEVTSKPQIRPQLLILDYGKKTMKMLKRLLTFLKVKRAKNRNVRLWLATPFCSFSAYRDSDNNKREIKDFPKLPLATSFIAKTLSGI